MCMCVCAFVFGLIVTGQRSIIAVLRLVRLLVKFALHADLVAVFRENIPSVPQLFARQSHPLAR